MSVRLRYEQCCANDGCLRPARHADLCTSCYMAAAPAVRALCDLLDRVEPRDLNRTLLALADDLVPREQPTESIDALELWWALPAVEPKHERRAA